MRVVILFSLLLVAGCVGSLQTVKAMGVGGCRELVATEPERNDKLARGCRAMLELVDERRR